MLYSTSLSKMVDDIFSFQHMNLDASYAYDSIKSDKEGTKITVVVPGFSKEDLELNVSDNYLTLSSKLEDKKFNRSWKLSDAADAKAVSAECKNGLLTISVPLKAKSDKVKKIDIK